tara:strand:- start:265 stop:627 length:363 start_codon:yes stop_codon:yes gene_type:complete
MKRLIQIYSYSLCGSCRKALKWLKDNNLDYQLINILEVPPSIESLKSAIKKHGKRQAVFNTSGISYRKLGAAAVAAMNEEQAIQALIKDPKLIKRPFVITNKNEILLGFKVNEWEHLFLN